jgi:hypothetical protein
VQKDNKQMSNETKTITPVIAADDLYQGSKKEFEATPPGSYRMALTDNIRVKRTKDGKQQLEVFMIHVDPTAKSRYKGVNFRAFLDGTDKNGKSLARQFGDLLTALGVAKSDIVGGAATVNVLGNLDEIPAEEQWKGVPAQIVINGDIANLTGREATVVVEASDYNGKTSFRANGIYPAS